MLITAVCPACMTRYQVQPTLRGQPMRCPNPKCRKVFVVPAGDGEKPKTPPGQARRPAPTRPQVSGNVGEVVPILPAEPAAPPKPPPGRSPARPPKNEEPNDWHEATPPARNPNKPAAPKRKEPAPMPDALAEFPAAEVQSWDAPPPVRRGKEAVNEEPAPELEPYLESEPEAVEKPSYEPPPRRGRGKAYALIAFLLLLVVAGLGVAGFMVWKSRETEKAGRFDEALAIYKKDSFRDAASKFAELQQNLPDGERKEECRFYEELSQLRGDLEAPPAGDKSAGTIAAIKRIGDFVAAHREGRFLGENAHDLGITLVKVVAVYGDAAVPATNDSPLEVVKQIKELKETIGAIKDGLSDEDTAAIDAALDKVEKSVAHWQRHEKILADLKRIGDQPPTIASIKEALRLIKAEAANFDGLEQEPAVTEVKNRLYDGHFSSVTYDKLDAELERPEVDTKAVPELAVVPFVKGLAVPAGEGTELVMARGILYAVERSNGQFRWALRVGLDGNAMPLRLPRAGSPRDRFLILSDNATIATAVDDGGTILWRYPLGRQSCLGKPLLLDDRVFLATADGTVHVLDVGRGRVEGVYRLGQRLSVGAAAEPMPADRKGNQRIYVPADDSCVYVLDVDRHTCVGILYTGHPAGSLRNEPLIVGTGDPARPGGYLILNQTAGVDETWLRLYALPTNFPLALADRLATPLELAHQPRLHGWAWFTPYADDEKVAVVTDAGRIGLFGLKLAENLDPPLFPLLAVPQEPAERGGQRLDVLLPPPDDLGRSRAQVVHARGEDLWVMANARLRRLQIGWRGAAGRALVGSWRAPLDLGLPLHAGQVIENTATDRTLLLMATQPLKRRECLATAVDAENGAIQWQRQLGMVCRGEPLPLAAGPDDAAPLLVAVDQSGGLFVFDPLQFAKLSPGLAQGGGTLVAETVDDNPAHPPLLLPSSDGRSVLEIAFPGRTDQIVVRQIGRNANDRKLKREPDQVLTLPAPLGGTPAVVGSRLLLPLENGRFAVLRIPADGTGLRQGTNWRNARQPGVTGRGYIIPLTPDRYLTADGQTGITHWLWKDSMDDPVGKEHPTKRRNVPVTYDMKAPIDAAPLALPPDKEGLLRVCVADVDGKVTLLRVQAEGEIFRAGEWDLKGRVTAGPFLRTAADGSPRVGCVVDHRRLVWLDPAKDSKPLWEIAGESDIVGEPHLVADLLVVAWKSGAFVGLDPATGKPHGEHVLSPDGVPPAISPVSFGPGRLFAPLADGTVLLPEQTRFGGR